MTYVLIAIVVLVVIIAKKALVIIPQSETKIVERLGRYYATLNPGINLIIPFIDRAKTIVTMANGRYLYSNTPMGIVSRASTDVFTYSSPVVNEAMLFMRRSLSQNLTASDIFAHLGKSHTFVENAFRAEVGVTVQSELQRLRLEEAKRLLKSTAMPLANIARRSGFSSPRYFAQAFRHALGVSPSGWRESQLA